MNIIGRAVDCFKGGNNCAQAVFATCAEQHGLDRETALKVASAFGGGMARLGETCGAVSGALMVIGLKRGYVDPDDQDAKAETYDLARAFIDQFEARHGTVVCRELLDHDIDTPESLELAREKGLFTSICPQFVQSAVEIIAEML